MKAKSVLQAPRLEVEFKSRVKGTQASCLDLSMFSYFHSKLQGIWLICILIADGKYLGVQSNNNTFVYMFIRFEI